MSKCAFTVYGAAKLIQEGRSGTSSLWCTVVSMLLCNDVFALVDDNSNKTTTKIMLFPSKYKYEYKLYAGKQDTPTYSELLQWCSCCMHRCMQQGVKFDLLHSLQPRPRCRIPIWRTFGRIQWHVISEPRITLYGAATWWIHCHDFRATCNIAGCKNSIRHIENRSSIYFIFWVFNAV